MKKILITGAGSFIGTGLERYLKNFPEDYVVHICDMVGDSWRSADFSGFSTVFHVAGIAHADSGKADRETVDLYYRVNTKLAVETAEKARAEGVGQFIFMSSAIVYGDSAPIGKQKHITKDTLPAPAGYYGDSKLQAEKGLLALQREGFKVVILRPPMIYGEGCKGNYPVLSSLGRKLPFFPKVDNRRSMLYVGNLTEFVRLMIDREEQGIFHPQNREYTNTSEMVRQIAGAHRKKMPLLKGFTWLLKGLSHVTPLVNKAFGSLTYDTSLSEYPVDYCMYTLEESIARTEGAK
jgi:UDP-glucose 4-epimerase